VVDVVDVGGIVVVVVVVLSPGPNVVVEVEVVDVEVVVDVGCPPALKLNVQSTGGINGIVKVSSNIGPNNCKLHSPLEVL
jgi:hypothetical protein